MAENRICLTSDVIFDFLVGDSATVQKIKYYSNEDLCMTVFTLFELRCTVDKQESVSELLNFFSVLDLDSGAAELAGKIMREDLHVGSARDTRSVINAATCISHGAMLLTKDRKSYEGIKGLKFV